MRLSDWWSRFVVRLGHFSPGVRGMRFRPRIRRRIGLTSRVQSLEDRLLLSAFTVSNNLNSGGGSLRQAILDAEANLGADTIVFQAGLTGVINVGSQMAITQDLTISGNGQTSTILAGGNATRFFTVTGSGVDFTLDGLTLRNGRTTGISDDGGAINFLAVNSSSLTILNSTLSNNSTTGGNADGGAISSYSSNSLVTIANSTISGNSTTGGSSAQGGAIMSYGAVVVTDSTLSGNFTTGANAYGGAIYSGGFGNVSIQNSTLSGNHVDAAGTDGGAIAHRGGTGPISIVNSTLSGNTAADNGGAIYSQNANVTILNSTLNGNSAIVGGGLYLANSSDLTLTNSTLSGNRAGNFGGGLLATGDISLLNSTVTLNEEQNFGGGGGLSIGSADNVLIQNSIVAGNLGDFGIDIDATGFAGTLSVQSSLIGRNGTTSLTPTVGSTPDVNGNFIGSNAVPIDPVLGSLQNNTGPTSTHALLNNTSLAFNSGNNSLATGLGTDQRGLPFARIRGGRVDMGAYEAPAPSLRGNTAFFTGTSLDEFFIQSVAEITIPSEAFTFTLPTSVTNVEIDGVAGLDAWFLSTPATNDRLILNATSRTYQLDLGNNGSFDTIVRNVASVVAQDNHGGSDLAILNDSSGDEVVSGGLDALQLNGILFVHRVVGFESVDVRSNFTTDFDVAELIDSSGADRFIAGPTGAAMLTSGRSVSTLGFNQVTVTASTGIDRALFRDLGGVNDTLIASATQTQRLGTGFNNVAVGFDTVIAQSLSSNDVARLSGDGNADALTARPGVATFSTTGVSMTLEGFGLVDADGQGGTDFLRFFGSNGNDTFVAGPTHTQMLAGGFDMRGSNFETMIGVALGGNDTAALFDSAGADSFLGFETTAQLRGPGNIFTQRAFGFDTVSIFGTAGGVNSLGLTLPLGYQLFQIGSWV